MHLAKTVFVVLAFALVACADGTAVNPDGTGFFDGRPIYDADLTPDAPIPDAAPPPDSIQGCTINGFTAATARAPLTNNAFQKYIAQSDTNEPFDRLTQELNYVLGASTTPHEYLFHETLGQDPPQPIVQNYDSCTHCLFIEQDCTGGTCSKFFLADFGRLEIIENGGPSNPFAGTLENIRLIEVTIDGVGDSVPVSGGDVWCLLSHDFNVLINQK